MAIEAVTLRNLIGQRRYRGEVIVERRADCDRRVGHPAPVVARAEARTIGALLRDLFPIAQSNATLATHFLEAARETAGAF